MKVASVQVLCKHIEGEITSVFEEGKHGVYTANCQDNVMPGKKFKSATTLTADGKGLMAMGAMNCRARGVNTAADPSVSGRWVGQPMQGQPLELSQNEEPSPDCQWGRGRAVNTAGGGVEPHDTGDHKVQASCYWGTWCPDE